MNKNAEPIHFFFYLRCGPIVVQYIHEDVDEAIRLIDSENASAGSVLALLTDCYETSLRLLVESACCFPSHAIDNFVSSEAFTSNSNQRRKDRVVDVEALAALRVQAETWFADDYDFYHAVVESFHRRVANTLLSSSGATSVEQLCPGM